MAKVFGTTPQSISDSYKKSYNIEMLGIPSQGDEGANTSKDQLKSVVKSI
jgi:hypothetical protein